jgi:small-conductance mechanosensitive channel
MQAINVVFLALALLAAHGGTELRAQQTTASLEHDEIVTAPVELDGEVLLRVRGVTSFPAAARARLIRDRIVAIAADPTVAGDSLGLVENGDSVRIVAGTRLIMMVTGADASLEQVPAADLAGVHLERVRMAIGQYREARSAGALKRATLGTLLATAALILGLAGLLWLWRRFDDFLALRLQKHIQAVQFQSFEVMRAERIRLALHHTLLGVRTLLLLGSGFVYAWYVLGLWPWTRGLSNDMVGLALGPLQVIGMGILESIPSLVFLVVLFFVIRTVLRLIRLFFDGVGSGTLRLERFEQEWAAPTYRLIRFGVIAFGIVVAYPYIPGSDSAAFKGLSLFIGVLFSLGSSSAISNIIAGYMLTYRRAFKIGDRVRIGQVVGDVIETRLQVTHLRSYKNEEIIVPNSQILTSEVLNYSSLSRSEGLILHTEVGIGYETPWRQVEAMLMAAARRTDGLLSSPPPFVLQTRLGDFAVVYELNAYCRDAQKMAPLYTELHRHILDVFNEHGVQIMTPAYKDDPVQPKIVPPSDWYLAPASNDVEKPAARVAATAELPR